MIAASENIFVDLRLSKAQVARPQWPVPHVAKLSHMFTPVGQYEKLRNRALRLVNRKPQWVPINQ